MKDPAVLFYTQDFLTGTFTMTDEQVGKYIRLLCLQQQNGGLTEKEMLKICGAKDEEVWAKFDFSEGHYFNKRMSLEANKRRKFTESRIANLSHMDSHMENSNKKDEISNKKEEKEIVFKSEVFEFSEKYSEMMLNKFCNYWTEKSKSGKMRYEFEKTFEINRRLVTWASRDKDIIKTLTDAITYKELLYRFNQGETDIWEKYEPITKGDKRSLWKLKL
jgi:hypothetical protein